LIEKLVLFPVSILCQELHSDSPLNWLSRIKQNSLAGARLKAYRRLCFDRAMRGELNLVFLRHSWSPPIRLRAAKGSGMIHQNTTRRDYAVGGVRVSILFYNGLEI
jgi:hypothetical protein